LQDNLVAATTNVQISQEEEEPHWGGSVPGRQIVPQDRFSGHHRLNADYFYENPVFWDDLFRRRVIFIHLCIVILTSMATNVLIFCSNLQVLNVESNVL
jgi:hypothetical protein